jgi:hypothetical protein
MALEVNWEGLDVLQAYIKQGIPSAAQATRRQVYQSTHRAFTQSQIQVPVRTGALKNSGSMKETEDGLWVIGYGGTAASYALAVHENLTAHHKPPTKAKYLEDPVRDEKLRLVEELGKEVEAAILKHDSPVSADFAEEIRNVVTKPSNTRHPAPKGKAKRPTKLPRAMTDEEISAAIHSINRGSKTWKRHKD